MDSNVIKFSVFVLVLVQLMNTVFVAQDIIQRDRLPKATNLMRRKIFANGIHSISNTSNINTSSSIGIGTKLSSTAYNVTPNVIHTTQKAVNVISKINSNQRKNIKGVSEYTTEQTIFINTLAPLGVRNKKRSQSAQNDTFSINSVNNTVVDYQVTMHPIIDDTKDEWVTKSIIQESNTGRKQLIESKLKLYDTTSSEYDSGAKTIKSAIRITQKQQSALSPSTKYTNISPNITDRHIMITKSTIYSHIVTRNYVTDHLTKDAHKQISADLDVSTLTYKPNNIATVKRITIPSYETTVIGNKNLDALNNMNPIEIVKSLRFAAFTKKNHDKKLKILITPGIYFLQNLNNVYEFYWILIS